MAALITLAVIPPLVATVHTTVASWGRTYADADQAPASDVIMVLGAQARSGRPSAFLQARLDLAIELFDAGKAKVILVTGANTKTSHYETQVMHDYLVAAGVPTERIVQDPYGFDTYDSCIRARDVYGLNRVTVVSQQYHLARTIATCRALGVDAYGVGDRSVSSTWPWHYAKGVMREIPAGVKMELDLLRGAKATASPTTDAIWQALERSN